MSTTDMGEVLLRIERRLMALEEKVEEVRSRPLVMSEPKEAPTLLPPPPVLTYKQAAEQLGVSSKTIARMADRGEISKVMVGGSPRIPRSEIERIASAAPTPSPTRTVRAVRQPAPRRAAESEADKIRAALRKKR